MLFRSVSQSRYLRFTKTHKFFEGFSFGFFGIKFFFTLAQHDESHCQSYGFYFDEDALVLKWAKDDWNDDGFIKFLYYPWSYNYCEVEFMDKAGNWVLPIGKDWKERDTFKEANQKTEVHPFRYVLKSGEVQDRTATVKADRYTHWQRWFGLGKLKLTPKRVRTSIWVNFDDEVSERVFIVIVVVVVVLRKLGEKKSSIRYSFLISFLLFALFSN